MTSVQEYSEVDAALANLSQKYENVVYDVVKPSGMKEIVLFDIQRFLTQKK